MLSKHKSSTYSTAIHVTLRTDGLEVIECADGVTDIRTRDNPKKGIHTNPIFLAGTIDKCCAVAWRAVRL